MNDTSAQLQQRVQEAFSKGQTLAIKGKGTKDFYGFTIETDDILSTIGHQGITYYEPNELVLTARAGTPLKEIEETLAQHGQRLSCEAPHFGKNATFAGMISAGLSGPGSPYDGSISDLILGCRILNGKGEILQFGGTVMKNVAGYDTSRLMAGSMGCLGVILEATMKVLPQYNAERTFRFDLAEEKASAFINKLTCMGYPVSASAYENETLAVRFSASEVEISDLKRTLQKDFNFIKFEEEALASYWLDLREQQAEFFNDERDIWRLSITGASPKIDLPGDVLTEWGGAQRWLKTSANAERVFKTAATANASACLFRSNNKETLDSIFQPLPDALMRWQQQLKKAFDPAGIFNPGRMYREL